jgi:hypothetical protein
MAADAEGHKAIATSNAFSTTAEAALRDLTVRL